MRKASAYNQIISLLQELHKEYPEYNMGKHISTAFDDCGDLWGMTDNEMFAALDKYRTQLNMDVKRPSETAEIDRIIKEGLDLENILKEEDNGDY